MMDGRFCVAVTAEVKASTQPCSVNSVKYIMNFTEFTERSEEHTSELQSHSDLVCRLLLEKKKKLPAERVNQLYRLAQRVPRGDLQAASGQLKQDRLRRDASALPPRTNVLPPRFRLRHACT